MTKPRVLFAAPTLPEHDREGGARDLADAVGFFLARSWEVTFVACVETAAPRHVRLLQEAGVDVHISLAGLPDAVLAGAAPELVVIAFWHLAEDLIPAVRRRWPTTRVVVSSIDLHFLRSARRIFSGVARGDRSFLLDGYFADNMIRELNTYAVADGVLTVSEKEAVAINDLVGDRDLAFCVPVTQGEEMGPYDFHERKDVLFVGNFRHEPNVEAVEVLCREIVPRLPESVLEQHSVLIVGNAPDERVRRAVSATPGVELVGWVPSLTPYLQQARVSVVPLRHGAGVKGKLVRALAAGTPTVSTTIGTEGLGLTTGIDVIEVDDHDRFAAAVHRLLTDPGLWSALSIAGHRHVASQHAPDVVEARLFTAVDRVLGRAPKSAVLSEQLDLGRPATRYSELPRKLTALLPRVVCPGERVLMVSKGDDLLLDLGDIQAVHFPHDGADQYLGWHPSDGADIIRRLEDEQSHGRHFFVIPHPSFWWLDHYAGLREYLESEYAVAVREDGAFVVWQFGAQTDGPKAHVPAQGALESVAVEESARPTVSAPSPEGPHGRTLVVGVYVATAANHVEDIMSVVAASHHDVVQRWIGLGGRCESAAASQFTVDVVLERVPKFELVNRLLAHEDLGRYERVVIVDDDIVVPHGFLDELLGWQQHLGFSLAQPARTSTSYIDHRIVQQQPGVAARRTRFVEIGPVVSIQRDAFDVLFPFDMRSPMGWGYENVWSQRIDDVGLRMGIIDVVPVEHSLRPPVANYSWDGADLERAEFLSATRHRRLDDCMRVLEVVPVRRVDERAPAH